MEEIWKDIEGFESYQVSNLGNIRNPYGKLLSQSPNRKGYMRVWLSNNEIKHKQFFVHRLVAQAFIPNINNYSQINHKDVNTQNNCVDNLEWCNNTYNQRYSNAITIFQYDLNGNLVKQWESISDASNFLNIPTTNISKCCKGQISTINGFIFLYDTDNIEDRLIAVVNRHKCKCKKVNAYTLDGILLNSFNSVGEAASYYKASPKSIINCCKGNKLSNNKIIFKYD